jgi:RimJ/RimL family protein N-acetyltransferase
MSSVWQPALLNEKVILEPLEKSDFDQLYSVAGDPLLWDQHPNPDRWKYDVFQVFFKGAMISGGALKILDTKSREVAGCTRFYDYNPAEKSVFIGYTFIGRKFWGQGYNIAVKELMLDYAFTLADTVFFHIGANNERSKSSIRKLGARMTRSIEVSYFGEAPKINNEYILERQEWHERKQKM